MPQTVINVMRPGGTEDRPSPMMMDHYAWMVQGPDTRDAVVLNRPIDQNVRPGATSLTRTIPKGRVCTLTPDDTMIPGVWDGQSFPVVGMLIGSDADDGDVVGGLRSSTPDVGRTIQVPFKHEANAPFWSLGAGYIYETSEFNAADLAALVPTTPLTAVPSMDDFDNGGKIAIGVPYVDHIIGIVVERPSECGVNNDITTVRLMGAVLPRIPAATITDLR